MTQSVTVLFKICCRCSKVYEQPFEEHFHKDASKADGLMLHCKECERAYYQRRKNYHKEYYRRKKKEIIQAKEEEEILTKKVILDFEEVEE